MYVRVNITEKFVEQITHNLLDSKDKLSNLFKKPSYALT